MLAIYGLHSIEWSQPPTAQNVAILVTLCWARWTPAPGAPPDDAGFVRIGPDKRHRKILRLLQRDDDGTSGSVLTSNNTVSIRKIECVRERHCDQDRHVRINLINQMLEADLACRAITEEQRGRLGWEPSRDVDRIAPNVRPLWLDRLTV
ncbi:MAG TPA: hypothetical protein VGL72_27560 [Bryobacteraceae bacterium]